MKQILVVLTIFLLAGCGVTPPRNHGNIIPTVPHALANPPPQVMMPKGFKEPVADLIVICHRRKYECQQFMGTATYDYDEHIEAYILPLVEVNLAHDHHGAWYRRAYRDDRLSGRVVTMPTFIVWEGSRLDGHELARWTGYEGMNDFLEQVNLMIEMYELKQW